MKEIYRIPPTIMEKYREELCFMVETNFTCMEAIIPNVKFIEPMGYEMRIEIIERFL